MFALRWLVPMLVAILVSPSLHADELPSGAYAQFGTYRFYHGPGLREAVLSPDGSRIATVASYYRYSHVADSEKEAYAATIVLWNAATGERIRELVTPEAPAGCLTFSSDGKQLATSAGADIFVFDVSSGKLQHQFHDVNFSRRLQFSFDDKRLFVTRHLHAVTSIDLTSGNVLKTWTPPAAPSDWIEASEYVHSCFLSPNGKFIAWALANGADPRWDGPCPTVLLITETATDKIICRKEFARPSLLTFQFSSDGERYYCRSPKISAWETVSGKEVVTLNFPTAKSPVWNFTLSPDGKRAVIISGWSEGGMWDLETKKPLYALSPGLSGITHKWNFSGDGKTLLLATNSTLRIFDALTGKERAISGHRYPVTARFSADGDTLFTCCAEATCSWDLSNAKDDAFVARQPKNAWEALPWSYSAEGRFVLEWSEDKEGKLRVRESKTGQVVSTLKGAKEPYIGLLSPDGTRVLHWELSEIVFEREVRLFDAKTGEKSGEFKGGKHAGFPVFSQNGRLVAWAKLNNDVTLYDAVTGKVVTTLEPSHPLPNIPCNMACLLFSPDDKYLIVTTYSHELVTNPENSQKWHTFPTRVFNIAAGKEVSRFYGNPKTTSKAEPYSCVACSPDNRVLAVAENESGIIRVFEIASGKVRMELPGHRHGVQGLAFSPDGRTLASGGVDNVVFLWDLTGTKSK